MLVTLAGAAIGLISSALPEILGLFRQGSDNRQELAVLELQIRREELQHGFQMQEIEAQADIREIEALHREFAGRKATYRWVEALISSVRPVMTYAFFALYAGVKYTQLQLALRALSGDMFLALPTVWQDPDQAIFATIIGFWFGSRNLQKYRRGT